jgi:hypothetical protein
MQNPGMAWRRTVLSLWMVLGSTAACAVTPDSAPETGDLDRTTAQALANALIADVETQALRPRVPAEYDAAKKRLLALVDAPAPVESRSAVYIAARAMLSTLDTDGHTLLWSKEQMSAWQSATRPESGSDESAVRTVTVPDGPSVLVLRPPQTTFIDAPSTRTYALGMIERMRQVIAADSPCAVVVDLSAQEGGNAWPAIAALVPLLTAANAAHLVDRDGVRRPVVAPGAVEWVAGGPSPANDLARFGGHPFAVVLASQTASAGEMVAIALRGEPGARTFGQKTYGATTANVVTPLPDEATVLLTTSRYAIGDEPPLRGPLAPDMPAAAGDSADSADSADATLRQAVSWVARTCTTPSR